MDTELSSGPDPGAVPHYIYKCHISEVIDGDTIVVQIDLGFDIQTRERVRLREIDTREIHFVENGSEEHQRGMVHKEGLTDWIEDTRSAPGEGFYIYSDEYDRGTYGRIIGDIWSTHYNEWATRYLVSKFDDVRVYPDPDSGPDSDANETETNG